MATLLLGAATAATLAAAGERTFAALNDPVQSLMSVTVPLLGILLVQDLRRSPGPIRLAPTLLAAVLVAAAVGAFGVTACATALVVTAQDPWRHAASIAVGGVLVQMLAQLVGTGTGLLLRSARLAFPAGKPANVLFRVSNSGIGSGDPTNVSIDPVTGSVSGEVTGGGFCGANGTTTNNRNYYHLFFTAQFDSPVTSYGTWKDGTVNAGVTTASGG